MEPLVSFVVTSFNHSAFIEESIESILAQDYPNTEVIIVDDGSTDGSVQLIEKHLSASVRLIRTPRHGVSAATNAGLRAARGEYIGLLASDDYCLASRIRSSLAVLRRTGADVVFSVPLSVDSSSRVLRKAFAPFASVPVDAFNLDPFSFLFTKGNVLCASTAFGTTSFFAKNGDFDPSLLQLQDFDYWLRAATNGLRIHLNSSPGWTAYRRHSLNLSGIQSTTRTSIEMEYVFEKAGAALIGKDFKYFFPFHYNVDRTHFSQVDVAFICLTSSISAVRRVGFRLSQRLLSQDINAFDEFGIRATDIWRLMNAHQD